MTWSYFTSYLDGTRSITQAERDELYTNLQAVLETSGCSEAGYSLNSTDQAEIVDSAEFTDLAGLDGPGASHTLDRLHAIIAAAADAFSNYDEAVATALADEGISDTERDAIIESNQEDFHLWNYYKRLIDALACVCEEPIVEVQTRGASFSRYGYPSFPGFSANARYRTTVSRGWGGGEEYYLYNDVHCTVARVDATAAGACESITYTSIDPEVILEESDGCADGFVSLADSGSIIVDPSSTKLTVIPSGADTQWGKEFLLNEITQAQFLAEVLAVGREAEWATGGPTNRVSYYTKFDHDPVSRLDVQTARMRFRFPVASHYRVSWDVIWTPRSWVGSSWVDGTPEVYESAEWVWDGTSPGGYDSEDESTWPVSPWIELPEATTDGNYTVANIVAVCSAPSSVSAPGAVGGYGV